MTSRTQCFAAVFGAALLSARLASAQATCTCNGTAPMTSPPSTAVPVNTLTSAISVDVTVLAVGVALLLLLFAVSFYYTVIWPKRAFLEYRRCFEELVKDDLIKTDLRNLKKLKQEVGQTVLYGGASARSSAKGMLKKIPTMKEIEQALLENPQEANYTRDL